MMQDDPRRLHRALVHDVVTRGEAAAIYAARRDDGTLFVGGPDFTSAEPSQFSPMSFEALLEMDDTFAELGELPIGHCASRDEPDEPWSFGVVPVGALFLVRFEARPSPAHAERDELGGAFVNCWI